MGREIRRVPADWKHPTYTDDDAPRSTYVGRHRPMLDATFEDAAREWREAFAAWRPEEHDGEEFWEGAPPPERDAYRPAYTSPPTHLQVYETVSEGTPVSPVFATEEEVVAWLVAHGNDESAARRFVEAGSQPSAWVIATSSGAVIDRGVRT